MSRADDFQRHAEKCQSMAALESDRAFRLSWLGIARSWLFLLEQERRQDAGGFAMDRAAASLKDRRRQFH